MTHKQFSMTTAPNQLFGCENDWLYSLLCGLSQVLVENERIRDVM